MGKITGFMEFRRLSEEYLPVAKRLKNYHEFVLHLTDEQARTQGARCMDCGVPFCQTGQLLNGMAAGCPSPVATTVTRSSSPMSSS